MAMSGVTSADQSVTLHHLFDFNRFNSTVDLLLFLVWSPFGVCLFILRTFIGLHALLVASLLPKRSSVRCFILRTMCAVLGVIVKEENSSIEAKSKTRVIVSNHITNIDHMAVDLVLPCIVPGVWDLPKVLNWGLGFHDFGVKQGRDVLIENVKMHLHSSDIPVPILCYPEGATTNGRVGLLKFGSWLFTLDTPMQPIFITVWRPIKVSPSVLGSRWWSDLFWFLIVPFSVFTIRYLPVVKKSENESPEDYAKRVQRTVATVMNVVATTYTDADKIELAKRLIVESTPSHPQRDTQRARSQPSVPNISVPSPGVRTRISAQIEDMARKVKEVLPQVPLNVILKDIKVTTNVDETITRLLDGTVAYVAEAPPKEKPNTDAKANTAFTSYSGTESSKPFYCGSKTFGKNANERAKSYQERKEALIAAARRRYLERHGMLDRSDAN